LFIKDLLVRVGAAVFYDSDTVIHISGMADSRQENFTGNKPGQDDVFNLFENSGRRQDQ
jgi:hypothetical protein